MTTRVRGFALLTPERRREIASRGGKRAHAKGVAHQWTRDEAVEAGRKGGLRAGRKGFAAMPADRHEAISSVGGAAKKAKA